MSEPKELTAEQVRYRVGKISEDLEDLQIVDHGTIISILTALFQRRREFFLASKQQAENALQAEGSRSCSERAASKRAAAQPQLVTE